ERALLRSAPFGAGGDLFRYSVRRPSTSRAAHGSIRGVVPNERPVCPFASLEQKFGTGRARGREVAEECGGPYRFRSRGGIWLALGPGSGTSAIRSARGKPH